MIAAILFIGGLILAFIGFIRAADTDYTAPREGWLGMFVGTCLMIIGVCMVTGVIE